MLRTPAHTTHKVEFANLSTSLLIPKPKPGKACLGKLNERRSLENASELIVFDLVLACLVTDLSHAFETGGAWLTQPLSSKT